MKKYLIHWFPFCSGGLCDRILGLSASICIAKILDRQILIKWDHTDVSDGFTINPQYNYYTYNVSHVYINLTNFECLEYFKKTDIVKEWKDNNIMIWSNVNTYSSLIENPYFDNLKNNYIDNFSNAIKEVLFNIFQINNTVINSLKNLDTYEIGIHIRNGDKQFKDITNELFYKDYIINTFSNIKKYIVDNNIKTSKPIFITSDCNIVYDLAKNYFDNFTFNEGPIIHSNSDSNSKLDKNGIHKVLLDLLTLCNCKDMLFIGWYSNYSRISSLYNPYRKIICYEYENDNNRIQDFPLDRLFGYFSYGKYN